MDPFKTPKAQWSIPKTFLNINNNDKVTCIPTIHRDDYVPDFK